MHGSYRGIILAAVGWLALTGSNHPDLEAQSKENAAQQQAADGISNIAATYRQQAERSERSKEGEPCQPGDDRRYSDLCAQWKAADAASDSAWWAWLGGIVGAFSLVGVIITLALNAQSNWISSSTARRQLRAYMVVQHTGYFGIMKDGAKPTFSLVLKNAGATPAVNVRGWIHCDIASYSERPKIKDGIDVLQGSRSDMVGPGCETGAHYRPFECTAEERGAFLEKRAWLYIFSVFEYEDVFGKRYRLESVYRSRGPDEPVAVDPLVNREEAIERPRWWKRGRKRD